MGSVATNFRSVDTPAGMVEILNWFEFVAPPGDDDDSVAFGKRVVVVDDRGLVNCNCTLNSFSPAV